jgi:uncharacterized protein YbjT (DUF2867 family)
MHQRRICILGGTGFLGRHITRRLAAAGHAVTIITRRRERQRDLLVLPTVQLVQGDVHNLTLLQRQFEDQDAVINLVGILNEKGHDGKGFERAHVLLADKVVHACRDSGVPRLLHMSALHASVTAPSHYLRTKGLGEKRVLESASPHLHVTVFRPSVIFGEQDSFTNRFAQLLRWMPGVFPLACPNARFQPVYVEDVAQVFVAALDRQSTHGQRYDLCGPRAYSLRELVEYLVTLSGRPCRIIGLNRRLSWLQAALLEYVPYKPFSLDNFLSLQVDSVCQSGFPTVFGLNPTCLEDVVPRYLGVRPARYSLGL